MSKSPTLADFELGDVLGEGGYAVVQQATVKASGKEVAMKMLEIKKLVRYNKLDTAHTERKVLVAVRHPNIVRLLYAFADPTTLYFALELCDGGDLAKYARKLQGLEPRVAQYCAAEILAAVEHLHKNGIIHRDLKPENVLLKKNGHCILTDFGTARFVALDKPEAKEEAMKRKNTFVGSPEYVAPEVLSGKPGLTSVDWWSFGCLVYMLHVGRPPFKGKSEYLTFQKILKRRLKFPDTLPEEAKDLVDKLLNLDPAKRLGCGEEGVEAIKSHPYFAGIDWAKLSETDSPMQEFVKAYQDKLDDIEDEEMVISEDESLTLPTAGAVEVEETEEFDDLKFE